MSREVAAYRMPRMRGHDECARRETAFSRRVASEFSINPPPSKTEGAGKTGCPSHPWSACSKKARGRTTGTSRTTGLPCAMVLRLIRDLPGDQALLPPSPVNRLTDLAPALGRQNHTISPSASRHSSRDTSRPSHPAPNVRDDREAPLLWGAGRADDRSDLPDMAMPVAMRQIGTTGNHTPPCEMTHHGSMLHVAPE